MSVSSIEKLCMAMKVALQILCCYLIYANIPCINQDFFAEYLHLKCLITDTSWNWKGNEAET